MHENVEFLGDDDSDDYSEYSDEFHLEESVADAPADTPRAASPPAPTPSASPAVVASPRAVLTSRGRGRQESLLDVHAGKSLDRLRNVSSRASVSTGDSSPRMELTARGRGRQESLLNMVGTRRSRQKAPAAAF